MPKHIFCPKPGGELLTLRQVSHICSDWVQQQIGGAQQGIVGDVKIGEASANCQWNPG